MLRRRARRRTRTKLRSTITRTRDSRKRYRSSPFSISSSPASQIAALPNQGLCEKCHEIIEWKKKYRKYKPLTQPGKCSLCHGRNVKHAYHVICQDCAQKEKVCIFVLHSF